MYDVIVDCVKWLTEQLNLEQNIATPNKILSIIENWLERKIQAKFK